MDRIIYRTLTIVALLSIILTYLISSLTKGFPGVLAFIILSLAILYLLSGLIANKILEPVRKISYNIENILNGKEVKDLHLYQELNPLLDTISQQKKELDYNMSKLKEGEKIRKELTANLSHELKTPLTSINGYAEMIENGMIKDQDIEKYARIIRKEGLRLLDIIDSTIKLSRIEDLSLDREFEKLNILDIAKDTVNILKYKALECDVNLVLKGKDMFLYGNKRMMEDLFMNLVDNSIKYNKAGGRVTIVVDEKDDFSYIKIIDTGIGIPPKYQARVFERFFMVDKSRSKKVSGTGLGLSIVKHIVDHHKGKIKLESQLDKGTEITISFRR